MRHYGILGKQQGKRYSFPFIHIQGIIFIHGEILDYIYQFYSFHAITMCTVSGNQSRFFRIFMLFTRQRFFS